MNSFKSCSHILVFSGAAFGNPTQSQAIYYESFEICTCPGGAPLSNLIGLYGVETLSKGEWAEGRVDTDALVMVIRAMAYNLREIKFNNFFKSSIFSFK